MSAIDATLNGNPAWSTSTQDGSASCVYLDGASWLETDHDTKLDFTNSFVVAFRFKRDGSQSNAYLVSKLTDDGYTNCWDVIYGFIPDTVEFHANAFSGSNPRVGSGITVADDDWHSIAYRYNGTRWSVVFDGVETLISASITFSIATASLYGLIIGSLDGTGYFLTGSIDDVRVWKGTIPSVADLEAWTASPFTSPSVTAPGRWAMDENTGTVAADSGSDPAPPSSGSIVSLTASTNSIAENGGTVNVIATMDATASATVTVAVGFSGSAATGSDYTLSTTSIAIASGQTSGSLTATAINDSVYEGNEQFTASITSVTGGGASASSTASNAIVTIVDDESQPTFNLSQATTTIAENGGTAILYGILSHASYQQIEAGITFGGQATLNTDYSRSPGIIITVPAGDTSGSISITALQDLLDEDNETITVSFNSVTNGIVGATTSLSFTITDDDPTPTVTVSASATTISENAGTGYFLGTLSAASGRTASATVNFALGTATLNTDFTASTSAFYWPAGTTTATIGVTSLADVAFEANETIVCVLGSFTNCSVGLPFSASMTIVNEYLAPFVSLSASTTSIAESSGSATVLATLDHTHSQNVTIVFGLGGTANSASDYSISTNSIVIASGATSGSISIAALQDSISESPETVIVSLASVTNGTAASAASTATVTIIDDDTSGAGATGLSGLSGLSGIH